MQELSNIRITKHLQSLGKAAIYSSNPYIESAIESLVPDGELAPVSPTVLMQAIQTNRRLPVKLPRKGAKQAAIRRARRRIGKSAEFLSEARARAKTVETSCVLFATASMAFTKMSVLFMHPSCALPKLSVLPAACFPRCRLRLPRWSMSRPVTVLHRMSCMLHGEACSAKAPNCL